MVMVMERGDASGAWYWKGLPTRTLMFERQKSAPGHKSAKECLTVMCCGNASRNHRLKFVVIGKAKKNHDHSRIPKQTAFLPIITTRKEHGCIGRFFKIYSTSILFQKFGLSCKRENYHRKQCCH
jgi:hypothetical protein